MYKQHLCRSDLHVHTNHSLCAPRSTQVESYLPFCEDEGIHLLGITNHLYAEGGYIHSTPYLDYILQVQKELDVLQNKTSVRFLFGCESELFPNREPGLNPQYSHYFNYVLFAPSHIFNCINFYEGIDLSSADKVRDLMVAQFCRACTLEYEIPVGICHPLYPICCPWEQEVVDGISDEVLADCFSLAAKHHRSIEIHACLYRNGTVLDKEGLSPSYFRLLYAAKACGCKFHFGSDAHEPDTFVGKHRLLERAAERIGLCKDDLWCVCDLV